MAEVRRIHYVANVRLPSERANAAQILQQCDALAARGIDVRILAPRRRSRFQLEDQDLVRHYGLRRSPVIERLACVDLIEAVASRWQRLPFVVESITFALAARRALRRDGARVVYSRDPWTLALLARDPAPPWRLFYEAHDLPVRERARRRLGAALRRCAGVVAITRGLADDVLALGVAGDAMTVLADGVDLGRFRDLPDRNAARVARGLAADRPLVVYAGHLYPWKGADVLVEAAAGTDRFDVLLVGGRAEDVRRIEALRAALGAGHVRLFGRVDPVEVPAILAAADVLVLPNSGRIAISARYTSPLKLFEYLAAARPVVASDLPSLREVLNPENAILVPADDPEALRAGIERVLDDPAGALARAARGRSDVEAYTWDARAAALEAFLRARGAS